MKTTNPTATAIAAATGVVTFTGQRAVQAKKALKQAMTRFKSTKKSMKQARKASRKTAKLARKARRQLAALQSQIPKVKKTAPTPGRPGLKPKLEPERVRSLRRPRRPSRRRLRRNRSNDLWNLCLASRLMAETTRRSESSCWCSRADLLGVACGITRLPGRVTTFTEAKPAAATKTVKDYLSTLMATVF